MIVEPGQTLAEKYRLVSLLGQGGMGSVWRAEHLTLRSPVAIKLIDPALTQNPEACERFMREAQSAASLRSPHVVQILDYGLDGGIPYIVMEMLEGESLASRLARVQRLSPAETARIMLDVGRAVGRAHQAGIVHRDLKPDNIFLVPNDESEVAKVLDFGIAKTSMPGMALGSGTRTGAMLGTPYYMSPEQASGSKTVDFRTDLWALGIIAFECMTGVRPFDEETLGGLVLAICTREMVRPSTLVAVPNGFDEWFARATQRDQTQRFQSAKELAQSLSQLCGSDPRQFSLSSGGSVESTGSTLPGEQRFSSTTVAGSMTRSSTASTRSPGNGARLGFAAAALALIVGGSGFVGWKILAPSVPIAPSGSVTSSMAGATTDSPAAATSPTVAIVGTAGPSSALSPVEPSLAPVPSASAATAEPAHLPPAQRAPNNDSPRPPVAPVRPIAGARPLPPTTPAPRAPAAVTPPAVPNTPTANPDPLGI